MMAACDRWSIRLALAAVMIGAALSAASAQEPEEEDAESGSEEFCIMPLDRPEAESVFLELEPEAESEVRSGPEAS